MAKGYSVRRAEIMYEPEDEEDFSEILSWDTIWLLKATSLSNCIFLNKYT